MIDGSHFGGAMRKARRALKFDVAALHPALMTVGSFDHTHQQDMVNMINTIAEIIVSGIIRQLVKLSQSPTVTNP